MNLSVLDIVDLIPDEWRMEVALAVQWKSLPALAVTWERIAVQYRALQPETAVRTYPGLGTMANTLRVAQTRNLAQHPGFPTPVPDHAIEQADKLEARAWDFVFTRRAQLLNAAQNLLALGSQVWPELQNLGNLEVWAVQEMLHSPLPTGG